MLKSVDGSKLDPINVKIDGSKLCKQLAKTINDEFKDSSSEKSVPRKELNGYMKITANAVIDEIIKRLNKKVDN